MQLFSHIIFEKIEKVNLKAFIHCLVICMVLVWGVCVGSLPSALIPLIITYQRLG